MKISIFINPQNQKSAAIQMASDFIDAVMVDNHQIIQVYFYGYAVAYVFSQANKENNYWKRLAQQGVRVFVCSTISDQYIVKNKKPLSGIQTAGLGQWVESMNQADRYIEFS